MKYVITIFTDAGNNDVYNMKVHSVYRRRTVRGSYNLNREDALEQTLDFIRQHSGDHFEIIDCDHLKREAEKYNMSHHK